MFNFVKNVINKTKMKLSRWQEYGGYKALFSSFGANIYASEIVRSCIRTLGEYTSKADAASSNKEIQMLLKFKPNYFMNGAEFLMKIRTLYEIQNTVFILIDRNGRGIKSFYPISHLGYETLSDTKGEVYIRFKLRNNQELVASWSDLVVLRKDYAFSDISGEDNTPILNTLEMSHKVDEALKNALHSTSNLRGVLKYSATAGLSSNDLEKKKDDFINSYLSSDNKSGIGVIDKNMDFIPVNLNPLTATWAQMREYRENVYRYFGVNDDVIQSKMTDDEAQVFYEAKIEPFLISLSLAMTSKVFTDTQIKSGAFIKFQSSAIQFISMTAKLALKQYIDIGALTINEWRGLMNLAPVKWGDDPIRRLDTKTIEQNESKENKEGEKNNE